MHTFSDSDLWNAICNDDEGAFTVLFNRYWDLLYNTSYKYLKDHEVSEEVVHDIFLNIWNRRKQLQISAFQNFLLQAVRFQIYNLHRTTKLSVVSADDRIYENYGSEVNKGDYKIREAELNKTLHFYLKELPERCQEIFQMSRIENLSNQEISTKLGISKRSVENQIALALKHLKIRFKHLVTVALLLMLIK